MYKRVQKDVTSIAKQSIEPNLIFNLGKTKFMLIASDQLSAQHKLNDERLQIAAITPNRKRNKMEATWFNY